MKVRRRVHPLCIGKKSSPNSHQRKWGTGEVWSGAGLRLERNNAREALLAEIRAGVVAEALKGTSFKSRAELKAWVKSNRGDVGAVGINQKIIDETKRRMAASTDVRAQAVK